MLYLPITGTWATSNSLRSLISGHKRPVLRRHPSDGVLPLPSRICHPLLLTPPLNLPTLAPKHLSR
jgi:hypothetical protein